jgi:hypothetical protein
MNVLSHKFNFEISNSIKFIKTLLVFFFKI